MSSRAWRDMKDQAFEFRLDLALYQQRKIEGRRADIFKRPLTRAKTGAGHVIYLVRLARARMEIIRAAFDYGTTERWVFMFDYGAEGKRKAPGLRENSAKRRWQRRKRKRGADAPPWKAPFVARRNYLTLGDRARSKAKRKKHEQSQQAGKRNEQ